MPVRIITTNNYRYGLVTSLEAESIKRGAASSSLNWQTKGDHVELRRGQRFLGTSSINTGNGLTTGLRKVTDSLGVEKLFGTYGKKLKYYTTTAAEWSEVGSNLLGAAVIDANGLGIEKISIEEYVSPAGNQAWINSPNCAGFFKIMVANPASYADQYDSSKNFKGDIKIDTNRTLLWGRVADQTGLYGSYIDTLGYTTVTAEATISLTGTLAFKASHPKATCFGILLTITGSGETYTDDFAGRLTGSLGGTGTINYMTGAYTVSNSGVGTVDYQWEDSTSNGIADFTKSSPRTAGQGFVFRQDEGGGPLQNVNVYGATYYCMHLKKTWALSIGSDDTSATNLPYRDRVGVPNKRASVETGDGVYYIDDQNPDDVKVRILTYDRGGSTQVIPIPVSSNLNINSYRFDQAAAAEWGEYVLFACRRTSSPVNDRVLLYSKLWKSWDVLDYNVNVFETFEGTLVAGDSISNNFIELFSGFDDFDNLIDNFWIGNLDKLDIEGLKKSKKLYVRGLIAPDQLLEIYIALDNGDFVKVGEIDGAGSYVDPGNAVSIGSEVIGRNTIGGGGNGATAYNYERLFNLSLDKFERVQIKYVATKLGYVSVSEQKYWDVRGKGRRVPSRYRG
jgi:hypothetical protein